MENHFPGEKNGRKTGMTLNIAANAAADQNLKHEYRLV